MKINFFIIIGLGQNINPCFNLLAFVHYSLVSPQDLFSVGQNFFVKMRIGGISSSEFSEVLVSSVFDKIHRSILLTEAMMSFSQNLQTAYVFVLQWAIIQIRTLMSKKYLC